MASMKIVRAGGGKTFHPSPDESATFIINGDETDGEFDYFDLRIGHLAGPPLHSHLEQDETFHVIAGELRMQVGDDMIDTKEGDYVFIPKGLKHTYVNLKEEPARAVGILKPGHFDKYVAEMAAYLASVGYRPDPAKSAEINAKHKQRQDGPPLAYTLGLKRMEEPGGANDATARELERLGGDWLVVHREMDGKAASEEELKENETHLLFNGEKVNLRIQGRDVAEGRVVVDPGKKPSAFDLTWTRFDPLPEHQGRTTLAIYELEGDTLRVCMTNLAVERERPTEFATQPNSNLALVVYKHQPA